MKKKVQGKATVIKSDGTTTELDHRPTLEEAQKIVGGYIQLFRVGNNITLVFDEEGAIKNSPINRIITDTYWNKRYGGFIVGDVIVLEGWRTVG